MVVKITKPKSKAPARIMSPPKEPNGLKYTIQTLGCNMNYSDSERVIAVLENAGYRKATKSQECDLFIFNTCSIRQKGEDRVFGTLKRLTRLKAVKPNLLVGLTGCMVRKTSSRNSPRGKQDELIHNLKTLDFVFKINDLHYLTQTLTEAEPTLDLPFTEDFSQSQDGYLQITPEYSSKYSAFVPIQIGCDKFCTYCIVPYARGREKSRSMNEIVSECRKLVENGCKEINLVGQTVNSYGLSQADRDDPEFSYFHTVKSGAKPKAPFIKLLHELNGLRELGLDRLRFSSSHPKDFSDDLIMAHKELAVLTPHIHLPIQSGNNEILARMNRKYTYEEYKEIINKFRAVTPGAVITTDIIVGFSGETETQFKNTVDAFKNIRWDQAYISRYSERSGTVASKCFPDDVSREEKARRWHAVNNLLKKMSLEKNHEYIGRTLEILVENFNDETGEAEGRSRENKMVQFPGDKEMIGQIIRVKITAALEWVIKGKRVPD